MIAGSRFSLLMIIYCVFQDYWSKNEVMLTPFFPSTMARDRFFSILSFLHLSDNSKAVSKGQPGYTPLQKLGEGFQIIVRRFKEAFTPGPQIAIDEAIIPWRGNLSFKVYNKDKPDKYGIKAYELCDSLTGYCSRIQIYVGKVLDVSVHGIIYDLVMNLVSPYLHQGFQLFMDNYYTSPFLFLDLFFNGTGACGTCRLNRSGLPRKIKDATLEQKGESIVMHTGPLMAMKMLDRKPVTILSTISKSTTVVTNKKDPKTKESVVRPECIVGYNKFMGDVDRSDQMLKYEAFRHRSIKWWKKVFFIFYPWLVLTHILFISSTQEKGCCNVF